MFHRSSPRPGHRRSQGAPHGTGHRHRTETNALRRPADRTRTRWLLAFALSCLLAAAGGIVAGLIVMDSGLRAAAEQARHRHGVVATTVEEASPRTATRINGAPLTTARVRWQYPAASGHTARVPVPPGTRAGQPVTLLVDDKGESTMASRSASEIAADAVAAGAANTGLITLAAAGAVFLRLRRVEARNLAQWEREWDRVEPRWSGRLRPDREPGDD
ncbi:hypothetical protein [Streptomyces sp. A1136]|uniref:Rv1733c family protein n=1 Tax=Streptomyces sp. A1136 TaxID=2563102 RepID=UPI00144881EA|nr:hypothetical protein [Streptomyces sp. A1136]